MQHIASKGQSVDIYEYTGTSILCIIIYLILLTIYYDYHFHFCLGRKRIASCPTFPFPCSFRDFLYYSSPISSPPFCPFLPYPLFFHSSLSSNSISFPHSCPVPHSTLPLSNPKIISSSLAALRYRFHPLLSLQCYFFLSSLTILFLPSLLSFAQSPLFFSTLLFYHSHSLLYPLPLSVTNLCVCLFICVYVCLRVSMLLCSSASYRLNLD